MHDNLDHTNFRTRLAEDLGWKMYNRLVESVGDVRKRGRLRFWQEQLLQDASDESVAISTAEDFIRVFDGASPVPAPAEPWTREVFLSGIEAFPYGGFPLEETPPEWMAAAWELERVRNELSDEMARTVSKTGDLAYNEDYLRYLSRSLSIARQVELFLCIRDRRNELREAEFRPSFERGFPDCVPYLPPPLSVKQLADITGMTEAEYKREILSSIPLPLKSDKPIHEIDEEIPF
jgi:hypothetical protein